MSLTDYQAKYFAYELTRRFPPESVEQVSVAFAGAQDEADLQREKLIAMIEGKHQQQTSLQLLFTIAWKLERQRHKLGESYTEKYMVS